MFFIVPALRLRQVVLEQDLRSNINYLRISKGKVLSIPQVLFSYTSGNHSNDVGLKCHMVNDFLEFSGQLHIKEFLDWLIEVESFFEDRNIQKKKQVKFVSRKLKGSAWVTRRDREVVDFTRSRVKNKA